jgi:hypothetical protein
MKHAPLKITIAAPAAAAALAAVAGSDRLFRFVAIIHLLIFY